MPQSTNKISCIILAGGEGRRTGGADKGLIDYNGRPLIEHVIDAIKHQVDDIVISANRNIEVYLKYSAKVTQDAAGHYQGPLAGIAACLNRCRHEPVLVVACDMPNLPSDLVSRLLAALQDNAVSIAAVTDRHQLALIVNRNVSDTIQQRLDNNQLKLIQWVESVPYSIVSFDDQPDAFINLNHINNSDT